MIINRILLNLKYCFIFFVIISLAAACDKGSDGPDEPTTPDDPMLTVSLQSTDVPSHDTEQRIEIRSNGSWSAMIEYPSGTTPWCKLSATTGNYNQIINITYSENISSSPRSATIVVILGKLTKRVILTQNANEGAGGSEVDSNRYLELPAINSNTQTLKTLTHYVTVNSKSIRNYTINFDYNERIAYWVAYPLSADYLGSVGRTDEFIPDPLIPASAQMNASMYGYDRGHQIPSGDRTATRDMNAQTFYYSNMTPQLGNFNQKIWADLEIKVRSYVGNKNSQFDTLYVVTGAVLKTAGGNESVNYINDKMSQRIAVPNYYYKVLLGYKKSGSSVTYKGIGFWFEHKANTGLISASYAFSIDDIERRTGMDFFKNLPDDVENSVESSFNPGEWGIN